MLSNISIQRIQHMTHGSKHPVIIEWLEHWKGIEEQIATEVATRTTNNKALTTDGLKSVIKALQREERNRVPELLH